MARCRNTESGVPLFTQKVEKPLWQKGAVAWRPPLAASLLVSLGAIGIILAAEVLIGYQLTSRDFDVGSFLLALLGLLILGLLVAQSYAVFSLLRTTYVLDAGGLTITCGAVQYMLPLGSINNVLALKTDSLRLSTAFSFLFGYPARLGYVEGIGDVLLLGTTRSLARMALIGTPDVTFGVSPRDRDRFVDELNARRSTVQFQPKRVEKIVPRIVRSAFWRDRAVQFLLLVALVGNVAVFAYVSYRFPSLPPLLPLHYNSFGEIDFIGTRVEAFKIPSIGTAALLADLIAGLAVYSREKVAAHLLLSTAVVVQVILLVATIKIVY